MVGAPSTHNVAQPTIERSESTCCEKITVAKTMYYVMLICCAHILEDLRGTKPAGLIGTFKLRRDRREHWDELVGLNLKDSGMEERGELTGCNECRYRFVWND